MDPLRIEPQTSSSPFSSAPLYHLFNHSHIQPTELPGQPARTHSPTHNFPPLRTPLPTAPHPALPLASHTQSSCIPHTIHPPAPCTTTGPTHASAPLMLRRFMLHSIFFVHHTRAFHFASSAQSTLSMFLVMPVCVTNCDKLGTRNKDPDHAGSAALAQKFFLFFFTTVCGRGIIVRLAVSQAALRIYATEPTLTLHSSRCWCVASGSAGQRIA